MNNTEVASEKKSTMILQVLQIIKIPVMISWLITALRFVLELVKIPEHFIFFIGLLWFTLGCSIYWAIKFHSKKQFYLLFILALLIFSPLSRIPVALAWWIDTYWQLGTHYGFYFDTFGQVLWNQVFYGTLVQIIPGAIIGALTFAIIRQKNKSKLKNKTISNG
jgi:hypothetical protein